MVRPASALAARLRESGVEVDDQGYVAHIADVLLPTLAPATREQIERDLAGKGGSELVPRPGRRPKFHAAHSSAALAANAFGPFLDSNADVPIADRISGGRSPWRSGVPRACVARRPPWTVSSTETRSWLSSPNASSRSPRIRRTSGPATATRWRRRTAAGARNMRACARTQRRYRYLGAAQLIKHYLGLKTAYPKRRITLAYVYWVPANAAELAPCAVHAAEVEEFHARVADPTLTLVAISYARLWTQWAHPTQPAWLRDHATALRRRYDIFV